MSNNMQIGMKEGTVQLQKHNEAWHVIAKQTINDLQSILQDMVIDIQHVGSTSIRNICAKPIIDLVVGLKDIDDVLDKNTLLILKSHGYIHDAAHDNAEKIFFYKTYNGNITHYAHAVKHLGNAWNSYVGFRDYLNSHYDIAQRYEAIKLKAQKECDNDLDKYYYAKQGLLKEINAEVRMQINNS